MHKFITSIFNDIDSKIKSTTECSQLKCEWKKEFGESAPHDLSYRLSYVGTIFSLYQKNIIQKEHIVPLIHMMYYEKFIKDDIVEELFFSRVCLEKKIFIKNMNFSS